jgi:hypothetical protein
VRYLRFCFKDSDDASENGASWSLASSLIETRSPDRECLFLGGSRCGAERMNLNIRMR